MSSQYPLISLADRVRAERELERFSQAELAAEIGMSRSALAHVERAHYPLSFKAAMALCRRLDLNPRWLATGAESKRPFVQLPELGLSERDLRPYNLRGVDFFTGYEKLLRAPLERWAKQNPPEKLIGRALEVSLESLLRRFSNAELIEQLRETVDGLKSSSPSLRERYGANAAAIISEISGRLTLRG